MSLGRKSAGRQVQDGCRCWAASWHLSAPLGMPLFVPALLPLHGHRVLPSREPSAHKSARGREKAKVQKGFFVNWLCRFSWRKSHSQKPHQQTCAVSLAMTGSHVHTGAVSRGIAVNLLGRAQRTL